jgi:hypothetical protein
MRFNGRKGAAAVLLLLFLTSCAGRSGAAALTDEALLDTVECRTLRYFTDFADPATGLSRERNNDQNGNIVTIGGSGFGLMALIAGAERDYISRAEGVERIGRMVSSLESLERFHGAWAHWYNADTGKPFSFSEFDDGGDLVETAFMVQGLLAARQWLADKDVALSQRCDRLWKEVEWQWYTQGGRDSLYWHWSKNYGFKMNHRITGYDETLITYVLAASSPTFPISRECYESCYKNSTYYYNGKEYYGIKLPLGMELGGPLFFCHYSFLGLDPRGLTDGHTNYFERNRAHTLIHRAYAIANPKCHAGYGEQLWGFTSSDDPYVGYCSHHPGTPDENGTVSPTAAISSIVYTPRESLQVIRHLYDMPGMFGPYGFYDAVNPGHEPPVVDHYLAIDQGPEVVMIENYRSGLLWQLFMSCPEIGEGLKKLGFSYEKTN